MIGKEKLALFGTLALLGMMGTCHFSGLELSRVSANEKGIELPSVALPDLGRLASPEAKTGSARDLFAAPLDTTPLPPLAIPLPPLPRRSAIAPPLRPGARMGLWGRFYRVPATVRPFEFPIASEEAEASGASQPEAATGGGGSAEAAYKKLYDWYRPNPLATLYGKILNPNRFDLGVPKLRESESLLFQEVDASNGKLRGKPTPIPSDRVLEYGFADTIANQIEIRKRRTPYTAAHLPEILEFADWCLEKGAEESKAFLEAERLFREAIRLDPANPAGDLGLGRFYERTFQLEQAYELYRGMTQGKFAHRAEPYLQLGKLQARLRLFELAEESLRRAAQIDGSSPFPKAALGEFLLRRGRVADAVASVRDIRIEPQDPEERAAIRSLIGRTLFAAGELTEASAMFRQALNTRPTHVPGRIGLAACLYAQGKFDEGLAEVDAALAEGTVSTDLYTARGLLLMRLGDYAGAERDLRGAIGLNPLKDFYPLSALSFLYEITGHAEEAFQAIEAAAIIDPTDAYVRFQKARLLASREDWRGARDLLASLLAEDLRFEDGLLLRGELGYLEGRHSESERYFALACEIDPKNAASLALRGVNLARGGQLRRAQEIFQKALSLDPDQPTALNGMGYCAYADGQPYEALRALAEVVDRHKEDDEHRRYASERSAEIQDHLPKVLWTDSFERSELRRDWEKEERLGPLVRLEAGAVRLDGQARDKGRTRLFRQIPAKAFLSFEAAVRVDDGHQGIAGLQVVSERKIGEIHRIEFEIDIVRLRNGRVATRFQTGTVEPEWKEIEGLSWPVGKPVRVAIERIGTADEPKVRIWFEGNPIGEAEKFPKLRTVAGDLRLGAFAEAEVGRQVAVSLDDVRVIFRDEKK